MAAPPPRRQTPPRPRVGAARQGQRARGVQRHRLARDRARVDAARRFARFGTGWSHKLSRVTIGGEYTVRSSPTGLARPSVESAQPGDVGETPYLVRRREGRTNHESQRRDRVAEARVENAG